MWEASYPFFEWHDTSWLGTAIASTVWAFPLVETIHILAMALMFGGLLVINLRLLGLGIRTKPVNELARTLMPFVNWGVVIMLLSGYAMFASEAIKCYSNDGFKFKMFFLALVLIFQYTMYRWVIRKDETSRPAALGVFTSFLSFVLWFFVGAGGRAIGFV